MGRTARKFSDEEISTIKALRENKTRWSAIGAHFGCGWETVRRAADPEYRAMRAAQIRNNRRGYKALENTRHVTRVEVPPEVIEFQRARYDALQRASTTQVLLGDPPPGFSALDKKMDANISEFARVAGPLLKGRRN